ncbi:phosphotransferase family protein [Xylanimonas ulmi]|uniref:Aminoglycoside phosphotransferase (APT) family kinase protein n=1 Tax=Xylanimonas ulmi TaxID=228973 RepID=A0A4V2EY29_9MICO|nr:phosphotransferase family protein [Xylanibacterium ulmi]RZS61550.1 aminoglycoside phosphotransferase (APT) family kinase protein [Xylanibacterium ulmi]
MTTTALGREELARVAAVLRSVGEPVEGELRARLIAGGRSNLTYALCDDARRWVLRTPPRAGRTPSAHDVVRELRFTRALHGAGVPVARAVAACQDEAVLGVPFAVSGFVAGDALRTRADLDALDDAALRGVVDELVSVLAALHAVVPEQVGLGDLARPGGYVERQTRRWSRQWEIVGVPALRALATEVARGLRAWAPAEPRTRVVHGDYRIDNTLLDLPRRHLAAIVDWELAALGDPSADVAMMCAYRDPAFDLIVGEPGAWTSPRLPDAAALAAAYEQAAGVRLRDWEAHLALASFKVAVIAAGIAHRASRGAGSGRGFATAGEAVAPFLLKARQALSAHEGSHR